MKISLGGVGKLSEVQNILCVCAPTPPRKSVRSLGLATENWWGDQWEEGEGSLGEGLAVR